MICLLMIEWDSSNVEVMITVLSELDCQVGLGDLKIIFLEWALIV